MNLTDILTCHKSKYLMYKRINVRQEKSTLYSIV